MPHLSSILDLVPAALLVTFRIGGLMLYGPVFGAPVLPPRVKVLLAFAIGLAIFPVLRERGAIDAGIELDLFTLAPLIVAEVLVGLVIGYLASLPLMAVQVGGLLMGQQMGLGFARIYNPSLEDDADVLGQVLFFMALAGFLLVGGHEAMVLAVLHSFDHVPLGGFGADGGLVTIILSVLAASFELALRIAAPVLCVIFLETVAIGFVSKSVPQLNILSLGFPLRILVGISTVALGLVIINDVVMVAMDETLALIFDFLGAR